MPPLSVNTLSPTVICPGIDVWIQTSSVNEKEQAFVTSEFNDIKDCSIPDELVGVGVGDGVGVQQSTIDISIVPESPPVLTTLNSWAQTFSGNPSNTVKVWTKPSQSIYSKSVAPNIGLGGGGGVFVNV